MQSNPTATFRLTKLTLHPRSRDAARTLARAGNCIGCHTAQGGRDYAGGRKLPTPFGTFYTPNITPDRETGIGSWTSDDFWAALHNGESPDGRMLYPTFPYTEYTKVTREDSDAIFFICARCLPLPNAALHMR